MATVSQFGFRDVGKSRLAFSMASCRLSDGGRDLRLSGADPSPPGLYVMRAYKRTKSIFVALHESAFGTKRTCRVKFATSAFGGKADMAL